MKRLLLSKKILTSLVGVVVIVLVNAGIIAPEYQENVTIAIVTIITSFNLGQGLADGLSKGQTSAGKNN